MDIENIIRKTRERYKYDKRLSEILARPANVRLIEDNNGKIVLDSIKFSTGYDEIFVYNTRLVLSKYAYCGRSTMETIAFYPSLEDFFKD